MIDEAEFDANGVLNHQKFIDKAFDYVLNVEESRLNEAFTNFRDPNTNSVSSDLVKSCMADCNIENQKAIALFKASCQHDDGKVYKSKIIIFLDILR